LGGWFGPAALDVIRGVKAVDNVAVGVYARLPEICAATDPLIDQIQDRHKNSKILSRLTRAADAVCAASQAPNTLGDRLKLVEVAISAITSAQNVVSKQKVR
jgi:hypothetical protein